MYSYQSRAYNHRQNQRRKVNSKTGTPRRVGGCSACAKAKAALKARTEARNKIK